MKLLTGKTFDEVLKDFNEESWRVRALTDNQILNASLFNGKSFMDAFYYLQKIVKYSPGKKINKGLLKETNIELVLDFYETLGLKNQVEPIVSGQHPMFETVMDKKSSSMVGHKGSESKLKFSVGNISTFDGVIDLAHELAHAINGHYNQMQLLLKEQNDIVKEYGQDSKEFKDFKTKFDAFLTEQSLYQYDCITETETMIIELLLLDYLIDRNTISPEDRQIYLNQRNNSFRNDLRLIFEEDLIYSTIIDIKKEKDCHEAKLTEEEYTEMCERLKKNPHYNQIINRFHFISNRRKSNKLNWHSSYRLRYIVGEVISTIWYKKYSSANKQEKRQMINDLKTFIANNDKLELKDAIKLLLKTEKFETVINNFADIHKTKEQNVQI